jgi:hypothetical protein
VDSPNRAVLADRVHRYDAKASLLFSLLTKQRAMWLRLQPGEVMPEALEITRGRRVVWSSFWPVSPNDTIELDLTPIDGKTTIRMRWVTDSPPDERGIAITRRRLNQKLGGDLRGGLAAQR